MFEAPTPPTIKDGMTEWFTVAHIGEGYGSPLNAFTDDGIHLVMNIDDDFEVYEYDGTLVEGEPVDEGERYRARIADGSAIFFQKPELEVWDGEGFPPVGTVCMVQLQQSEPMKARVDHYGERFTLYTLFDVDDPEQLQEHDCCANTPQLKFTPYNPEKEKEDELVDEALEFVKVFDDGGTAESAVRDLIQAGYRKVGE